MKESKQSRYQLRHIKLGLCRSCSSKRVNKTYCKKHRDKANKGNLRRHKLTKGKKESPL